MHFSPRNRHLYVEVLSQKESGESNILLPADYRPVKGEYIAARLIDWAPDCNGAYFEDDVVILRDNMIEDIKVGVEVFRVVLENHVIGVMEGENYEKTDIN